MLKFVKKPVKRRKSLLFAKVAPRVIVEDYTIDQFAELPERKRQAASMARRLGHDLDSWHRRSNDPAGRWNAHCRCCNKAVVVCTETPEGFDPIYGPAYTQPCPIVGPHS
jgi:hypothetical protein